MAADRSRTVNQALVIHDPRISMDTFDSVNSTVTQTGPHAGVPEPSVVTQMALQASGEQTEAITVFTAQAGGEDAAWGWRDSNDVDYYWDGPTAVRQVRALEYIKDGESGQSRFKTSSVTYKGNVLTLAAGESYTRFEVLSVLGADDEGSNISFVRGNEVGDTEAVAYLPGTLCIMPNGKLHLYANGFLSLEGETYWSIDLYTSEDGFTYQLEKRNVLNKYYLYTWINDAGAGVLGSYPISVSVAATNNGTVLLVDWIRTDTDENFGNTLSQFYSTDGGFSFTELIELEANGPDDTEMGSLHRVVALPDQGFLVVYACLKSTEGSWLYQKRLRSCLIDFSTVTGELVAPVTGYGTLVESEWYEGAELDIKLSQDNYLYLVYVSRVDDALSEYSAIGLLYSKDYGRTWLSTNNSLDVGDTIAPSLFNPRGEADVYLNGISMAIAGGSIYVQGQVTGDSATDDSDFFSLECGGWTSISRPFVKNKIEIGEQIAFDYSYIPLAPMPDLPAWSVSAMGTPTRAIGYGDDDSIYENITTNAFQTASHVLAKSEPQTTTRQLVLIDVEVITGRADFEFYQSSTIGGFSAAYRLRITTTQFTIYSLSLAGSVLETGIAQDLPNPGGRNQFYIGIDQQYSGTSPDVGDNTRMYIAARAHNASTDRTFAWTEDYWLADGDLTLGSKTQLEYNVAASSNVNLYSIQVGWGDYGICTNDSMTSAGTTTIVKGGRLFSDKNVYAGKNVSISAYGGPTYIGDEWTIDPVYDYGLANLFEEGSPSPNVPWRATDDSEQNIIFRLSDLGNGASIMSKAMGVFFYNANFEKALIYGSNTSGAGAWTLLDTIESNSGFEELSWVRKGDVIRPPAEDISPSAPYIPMNALIGSTFYDDAEEAARKIVANTEGVWIEGDLNVTPRIKIGDGTGFIGSEEAGAGYIWIKDFGAIINNLADYEYIRIRIPACTTADGYISLGALVVGNVHYLGRRHGRQRTMSRDANVQTTTLRSGAKRTRVLGPTRREVTFSWANENEIDETQLYTTTLVDPDYISIGGIPQNTVAGTTKLIEGIIEELQGEHGLVTYVSNVPSNGSIKPFSFLRGRIVSSYNEDVVLGNEMDNELKRVSSVTISEEV